MNNSRRIPALSALALLIAVVSFGQERTQGRTASDVYEGARLTISGTVASINSGSNEVTITPDGDQYGAVRISTDSLSTQYNGFGGVINGSPEIFIGSRGFSNVRVGDRIEVRGVGRSNGVMSGDVITLLGRAVAAGSVGVGETRPPGQISTPTASGTTPTGAIGSTEQRISRIEGVVRQVNAANNTFVVETDRREIVNVRGTTTTPVYYQGSTYRISNLEVGDRIAISSDNTSTTSGSEVRARSIDVVRSIQDASGQPRTGNVGQISGRVTSINRNVGTLRLDTGRGETTVDLRNAQDTNARIVRATDFMVGDQVQMSGSSNGETFLATTVTWLDDNNMPGAAAGPTTPTRSGATYPRPNDFVVATIYGVITESLRSGPQLAIRDTQNNNRITRVWVTDDFAVRNRTGSYVSADTLKEGDAVTVKAYRDADGTYIAQTIRLR